MIRVTALTSGANVPSSRFRVRQFISPLSLLGIEVFEYPLWITKYTPRSFPAIGQLGDAAKSLARIPGLLASRSSDITWLERELVPGRHSLERFVGRKHIFDVDDAIWLNGELDFSEKIASGSVGVIAGNQFLAEHYQKVATRVWVVPTSVDTNLWKPSAKKETESWVIGWIGSSSNLKYLYDVEEPLARFLSQCPESKLKVVCNSKPSFKKIPPTSWCFTYWSVANEVREVQQMDVGLMPLPNTEWAYGKCAFKMILYMAVGIPVVASPIGQSRKVLQQAKVGLSAVTNDDWYRSLCMLFCDRKLGQRLGAAGRCLAEKKYSVTANAPLLARMFQEVHSL